jgi:DNA-directed RNA polymerase subunit RPC12/RpoP
MKILPKTITFCSTNQNINNNTVNIYLESSNSKKVLLTGVPIKEADYSVLETLYNKKAIASELLYFAENYKITNKINKNDLEEDIKELLHTNTKVVNEKAPLLVKIENYPLYESDNYILRGNGDNKIEEYFDDTIIESDSDKFSSSVNIEDINLKFMKDYHNHGKYEIDINGYVRCPKCDAIFDEEDNKDVEKELTTHVGVAHYNKPVYNDDGTETTLDDVSYLICPNCGYKSEESDFYDATVSDIYEAPNAEELVPGITKWYDTLEEDGTEVSDIPPKIDYDSMNQKRKINPNYENIKINDLDENEYTDTKGFIRDVDGFYKRGNFVLVQEFNKLRAISINKLYE